MTMLFTPPDFLIIGAMKCGTTSLHDYLGKHPDIYTTVPKEIHFFTESTFAPHQFNHYLNHFQSSKKISGASPQNYTKRHRADFSGVPGRLAEYLPEVKLIYLVRDPIDRINSHYVEAQEGGYAPKEGLNRLVEADLENNHYVRTSSYYYQLEAYLHHFSKEQILVVDSNELRSKRLETLNTIFRFLNVSPLDNEALFNYTKNKSTEKKRLNALGRFIKSSSSSFIRSMLPEEIKHTLLQSKFFGRLRTKNLEAETLNEENTELVKKVLQYDIDKLRAFSGLTFEDWSL